MQLFEIKNDIARIEYNPAENNLLPSDFLLIEDSEQKLIAQILNIFQTENQTSNIAEAKFCLYIDEEDNLTYYNGFQPSKESIVIYVKPEEVIALLKEEENNIYFGNLSAHKDCFVNPSITILNDYLYIQSDRDDKTKIIIQNLISELYSKKQKILLLDFDGRYNSVLNVERVKIAQDLKLPLNTNAFNTILRNDTKDCSDGDIAVIENIVAELETYINSLNEKFLPFSLFKSVIESELASNPISGLMMLNKKLNTYQQENLFAENAEDFTRLDDKLISKNVIILDASETDEKWHNFIIETVIENAGNETYIVMSLNDLNIDEKLISRIYAAKNIIPIVSTNYENPNRNLLKTICKNQILFKPAKQIPDTDSYMTLLNKINAGEFILYGDSTLYLSFIIELQSFDATTSQEIVENEIKQDLDNLLYSQSKAIPVENINQEQNTSKEEINDEDLDFLDDSDNENNEQAEYNVFEPMKEPAPITPSEENVEIIEELEPIDILEEIIPDTEEINNISTEEEQNNIDEILEIDEENIEIDEEESQEENNISVLESIEDQIIKQHTQVQQPAETENTESELELDLELEDEIDSIDELATETETQTQTEPEQDIMLEEESDPKLILETDSEEVQPKEENTNTQTQKLPVYDTDDEEENDTTLVEDLPFKIGDRVFHPKHGNGIIEGFANYSNKIVFCQIEFENVGRRILDPRISGLQKI